MVEASMERYCLENGVVIEGFFCCNGTNEDNYTNLISGIS